MFKRQTGVTLFHNASVEGEVYKLGVNMSIVKVVIKKSTLFALIFFANSNFLMKVRVCLIEVE